MIRTAFGAVFVSLLCGVAFAQTQNQQRPPQSNRTQAQQPAAAQKPAATPPKDEAQPATQPAAEQRPVRTETRNFDSWSVSCAEFENPATTRCAATLQVVPQDSKQVVFAWTIAVGDDKKLVSSLITPTGVQLMPGIELKLGKANARKVAYTSCTPRQCAGAIQVDELLVKDATQAGAAEAAIQMVDGRTIRFNFPVKGLDAAVAQLRK